MKNEHDTATPGRADTYATRAEAETAKGPRGTVVESLGKIWLFTIAEAGWRPPGGERVAKIGPLLVKPDTGVGPGSSVRSLTGGHSCKCACPSAGEAAASDNNQIATRNFLAFSTGCSLCVAMTSAPSRLASKRPVFREPAPHSSMSRFVEQEIEGSVWPSSCTHPPEE